MKKLLCLLFGLVLSGAPLLAADARFIGLAKVEEYTQTGTNAPVLAGPGAFSFYSWVEISAPGSVTRAVLTHPEGESAALSTSSSNPLTLDYLDFYDNPLVLDSIYPPGDYQLALQTQNDGERALTLSLPENFHPNTPRLMNWEEAQKIHADKPFDFLWEPFVEGTTNDFIQLLIFDLDGNEAFSTPEPGVGANWLDGTAGSATLPAGTIELGSEYRGVLMFARVVDRDDAAYPGATALAGFVRQTSFLITTAGTPDLPQVQFDLSFSYFAYGGDFLRALSVTSSFPAVLDDCYVARLRVNDEEFVPIASDVTFSSPPGTAITNRESAFRYVLDDGVYFESPCFFDPTNRFPGIWTVRYNNYPLLFDVPDAEPLARLVMPAPSVTLVDEELRLISWKYFDAQGNRLLRTPSFITNVIVELYDDANLSMYSSGGLPSTTTSLTITNGIDWADVRRMLFAYQDNYGNWYGINFDHSPPGGLTIVNESLPLGSLGTPYDVRLVASNGVPPYIWSVDGELPPGLRLNSADGSITGVPQERGLFRFGLRVDDQADAFEYDFFSIAITSNGPPIIVTAPEGGAVDFADYTFFEVEAEGTQPLTYQWLFNGEPLTGETNTTLWLIDITEEQEGQYAVRVSNALGSVTTVPVRLEVRRPPVIVTQPASQTVQPGTNITFRVEVQSAPPIFYQWRRNGELIPGATNETFAILNAQPRDAGSYSVLVAGPEGLVRSEDASLQFSVERLALTNRFANRGRITAASGLGRGSNGGANRDDGELFHGGIPGGSSVWVTWVAPASGVAMFTTRGSNFDTLLAVYTGDDIRRIREIASDDDGEEFFASLVRFNAEAGESYHIAIDGVYGGQGEILLNWALDTTGERLPEILKQPVDAIVAEGSSATFSLIASNPPPALAPLQYQWYLNGLEIPGETNETLTVPSVDESDLGLYFAVVVNSEEFVFSDLVVIEIVASADLVDRRASTEDKFANISRQTNSVAALHIGLRPPRPLSVARGYSGSQVFSTQSSSTEAGEPNHCGVVGGASQWFSYQAPASGFLTIDTDGSDFDTVLTVYTGSDLDFTGLQEVSCDNDGGADGQDSRVGFPTTAGTLYLIVVDGVQGAKGTARLNYTLAAPPSLRAGAAAIPGQLRLSGAAGGMFTIEASTNLVDWTSLVTTNLPSGTFLWTDPRPATQKQFYRGMQIN